MKNIYKYNIVAAIFLTVSLPLFLQTSFADTEYFTELDAPLDEYTGYASKQTNISPREINPVHMLVVFSKFKNEEPNVTLAPEWAKNIFNGKPGSVNHYYDEISFGKIKVSGDYLPKIYELPKTSVHYKKNAAEYVKDLIRTVDNDKSFDFSQYDNDGPDGIPGSEDDDGYVDFLVLIPISRPADFIWNYATGVASLMISDTYYTHDKNTSGRFIKLDKYAGCIVTGQNQNQAIGLLCHEYCHYFGAPDLYDLNYKDEETDSAGIGFWGLMSHGLLGWNGYVNPSGPVGPCAYTRLLLGCIGINNSNLIDVYGVHRGIRISDVGMQNGNVYRIWVNYREYFLLEHRRSDGIFYDRQIPKSGLLIWHILENYTNNNEERKTCDLECADGRYSDAGYPNGNDADANEGKDNLDFWSHTEWYTSKYGGNLGDATDVFDGTKYTSFGPDTNPNSDSKVSEGTTKIEVFNIHREGYEIVVDVNTPPFTDWSKEKYPLIGTAFHRFNIIGSSGVYAEKANAIYLINYDKSRNAADVLVTVYNDSLTVDNLRSLNYFDVQRTIEKRISENEPGQINTQIIRKNISLKSFGNGIKDFGITVSDFGSGAAPRWIQKISLLSEKQSLPAAIKLNQNYPNPFNSITNISYNLLSDSPVTLEVFNLLGQKVMSIDRGYEKAGSHVFRLNAGGLSSGIYLYRIRGKSLSQTKKFLLIR